VAEISANIKLPEKARELFVSIFIENWAGSRREFLCVVIKRRQLWFFPLFLIDDTRLLQQAEMRH
jgi:hypothetical protein